MWAVCLSVCAMAASNGSTIGSTENGQVLLEVRGISAAGNNSMQRMIPRSQIKVCTRGVWGLWSVEWICVAIWLVAITDARCGMNTARMGYLSRISYLTNLQRLWAHYTEKDSIYSCGKRETSI